MRLSTTSLAVSVCCAVVLAVSALWAPARAQLTTTPGPGGIPIAPGAPVGGYTPGGKSFGGVEISPGRAARDVPMYRDGPGDVPVLVVPDKGRGKRGKQESTLRTDAGCPGGTACLPRNLALTITSRAREPGRAPAPDVTIDTIGELFAALRGCWEPPAADQSEAAMQMTVRFSFRRTGELFAPPVVTYSTRGVAADRKQAFRQAIDAALGRCGRLSFSEKFSAAIAGRPISVRFVDDRAGRAGAR